MKSDTVLVAEAKRGSREAFSQLVYRHQRSGLQVALRVLRDLEMAEDVVQDSFFKAYQKLHDFEGRSSFKSWLIQIIINQAKNSLRRSKRHVNADTLEVSVAPVAEIHNVHQSVASELREHVAALPEKQRMAVELRIYEDLSFHEIAEIMECPYDTAKANFRHGLMKLRHEYADECSAQSLSWFQFQEDTYVYYRTAEGES